MNQADVTKVVSKLRYNVIKRRNLKNMLGPQGRHDKIRKVVTALFQNERLELNYNRGDESRGYAERLISDAIRYGDCHKETMEMANYWLLEKQLVHKLFKVLVPRYQNCPVSYTKMWRAPKIYTGHPYDKCVLELRGNVFPPLDPVANPVNPKHLIHNILLDEARREFRRLKYAKMAENLAPTQLETDSVSETTQELNDLSLNTEPRDTPMKET